MSTTSRSEDKETWFKPELLSTDADLEAKQCRCLLHTAWAQLERYGDIDWSRFNPYAICNASLSRARRDDPQYPVPLGSTLASSVRRGTCTFAADFDQFPTNLLYAHAAMRSHTAKGSEYFSDLPDFDTFNKDQEAYRKELLERVKAYQELESRGIDKLGAGQEDGLTDDNVRVATPTPSH